MEKYKLRNPIGDEAYMQVLALSFLDREIKDKYERKNRNRNYGNVYDEMVEAGIIVDADVYVKVNKVTQNGMPVAQEKLIQDIAEIIYDHNKERIVNYAKQIKQEIAEGKREPLKPTTKEKPKHSKFIEVIRIPIPSDPTKLIPFYVNYDDLKGTEEQKQRTLQKVKEDVVENESEHLKEYIENCLLIRTN